jgi:hypothetical protein
MWTAKNFSAWPLHDAVLHSITVDWVAMRCVFSLHVFVREGEDAQACQMTFEGVKHLIVPHQQPWGPSAYVNAQSRAENGAFVIEMQSGDEIRLEAIDARLVEC